LAEIRLNTFSVKHPFGKVYWILLKQGRINKEKGWAEAQVYFFHFWLLVQTLGRDPTVGSPWSSSTPPSLGRGRHHHHV